ncbi:hypothetical protein VNO77_29088 [Canavalia gladiata]|uniref:Inositol polyphosphate multikinase n=1 Tax=Canavalia gladiata TaxID=3824 RepID=A0AAN9KWR5_CANGL
MLKVPEHQVAGHKAKDGILGPLVDDSGKFYKPLQNDSRGSTELAFYTSLSSHPAIPPSIRTFFPAFHGTKVVNASNGIGPHPHLVLEDLLSDFTKPSVIDIKIGSRTWYPQASEDYINKCLAKDRETSTASLGFRISGLKDAVSGWEPTRKFLQNLSAEGATLVLRRFVSSNDDVSEDPNCVFAKEVFGAVLERLLELKNWFEVQTAYHFYSCSVLVVYEKGEAKGKGLGTLVKLVDFAHVLDGNGVIDFNFLGGLCSLIKFVKDMLASLHHDFGNCICNTRLMLSFGKVAFMVFPFKANSQFMNLELINCMLVLPVSMLKLVFFLNPGAASVNRCMQRKTTRTVNGGYRRK